MKTTLIVLTLILASCGLEYVFYTGRICGNKLFQWGNIEESLSIASRDFYPRTSYVEELSFQDNGDWLLRYTQEGVQYIDAQCEEYRIIPKTEVYWYDAGQGEYGTVYSWTEKAYDDFCDGDGDGIPPRNREIRTGWFASATPNELVCTRRAGVLDTVGSFIALLFSI